MCAGISASPHKKPSAAGNIIKEVPQKISTVSISEAPFIMVFLKAIAIFDISVALGL